MAGLLATGAGLAAIAAIPSARKSGVPATAPPARIDGERTLVVDEPLPREVPREAPVAAARIEAVRGRVLDVAGTPVADVEVGTRGARARTVARTDAEGRFDWPLEHPCDPLYVSDPRWITVVAVRPCERGEFVDAAIVVAPPIELSGRVFCGASGVAGARVAVELDLGRFCGSTELALCTSPVIQATNTDASGWFRIAAAPAMPGMELRAYRAGLQPATLSIEPRAQTDLRIELLPPEARFGTVRGVVEHQDGARAPRTVVRAGTNGVVADERGEFTLPLQHDPGASGVTARLAGFEPGECELRTAAGEVQQVVLRLGAKLESLRGTIVDAAGAPAKRCRVDVFEDADCTRRVASESANSKGEFEVAGLRAGSYWLELSAGALSEPVRLGPFPAGRSCEALRLTE